jgi:hypothetical protein
MPSSIRDRFHFIPGQGFAWNGSDVMRRIVTLSTVPTLPCNEMVDIIKNMDDITNKNSKMSKVTRQTKLVT